MGSQATKPLDRELSASSAGAQRASDYLIGIRVLNGEIHRSACVSRSDINSLSKRFNKLWGSPSSTTGGMNRARIDRQNGVAIKSSRHHVRQRLSVRAAMLSSWHSAWPEPRKR
jgi:hypothetical protein